ncbi:MAG: Acetate kinase [Betaproteobacteria bacterium ADurb.Bin341]|nr:MAG: Acetate kinase [Betaproteobacteria bacterium ADurb.Bin341]
MDILVINSGSSSIKFQLINMHNKKVLCKGLLERIGIADGIFNYESHDGKDKIKETRDIPNHRVGIKMILDVIQDPKAGVIKSLDEIEGVGHRIVHGGEKINTSVLLTEANIKLIEECIPLAPLHNPPNLMGVEAVKSELPNVPHVGVFDTAFHATMPEESYIYGLNYEYYEKHRIRRFGFHGTSHQYVAEKGADILGIPRDQFNCVTCHMGNGVSFTAVKNGKSFDTSLGYGTMCGIPMGTRAGDLDPAILLHMLDNLKMSTKDVHNQIYNNSGLKGMSGLSNDMRDVQKAAAEGNKRAELALEVFAHAAKKYIGAFSTLMGGTLHAIIFTAGIGENDIATRERICNGLEVLGARIDKKKNDIRGEEKIVSTDDSRVKIMVIPTNEELMIALETHRVAEESH